MVKGGAIVSFVGHAGGAAIGVTLVADPDPTASKAFGVYMVVVNVDGAIADVRTFCSGQPTPTVLHEAVRQGLIKAGVEGARPRGPHERLSWDRMAFKRTKLRL